LKKVIILNKKEGETPLEALEFFRKKNPKYLGFSMTYAGRLDPMASGVLLILANEETKNKEKYLALDKEYEFEVLFGFATDTHDILGKIVRQSDCAGRDLATTYVRQDLAQKIKKHLKSFIGESVQKYPMYSSKTVKGKPLFTYARAGEEVEIPDRKIFIKKLKLEKIREIDNKKLFKNIEKRIGKVNGDFRQEEILKIWQKTLFQVSSFKVAQGLSLRKEKYYIGSFKVSCSSGTYVRVLANSLGLLIDIPALAFSIKRTKIGKYVL